MKEIQNIFPTARFYGGIYGMALLFLLSYFFPLLEILAEGSGGAFLLLVGLDGFLLLRERTGVFARRQTPARLSNGDPNPIDIRVENHYAHSLAVTIVDELPVQLQIRDLSATFWLKPGEQKRFSYSIRPVVRGEYEFGMVNLYVATQLGLLSRRFRFPEEKRVAVYPSFIQMRKFELLAISNRLTEAGIKKIRRVGHTMEFEQIREYVPGDDYRTINWKATARRRAFMVNHYQDEKAQPVYSVIDMGRVMKMPFEGLSLLDYAINASLVISNIALRKQDKAGIITFSRRVEQILPADRKPAQISQILEMLYKQTTAYQESDYQVLFATLLRKISQRSLILLFTNFETLTALKRQLPFLRKIARKHLLVVIFFENTELRQITGPPAKTLEGVYRKTIAEQFAYEKRQIVKELQRYGIYAVLTPPQQLTVNTINQYLSLKARGLI